MSGATGAAAVIGGTALAGSAVSAYGASQAADAQTSAADQANATQLSMFNATQQNLAPYLAVGNSAAIDITKAAGLNTDNPLTSPLLSPVTMDQATLEKTPGFQFEKQQGLEAVQNGQTALGLGASGAEQKAAAQYAENLASTNYEQQFNNAVTNQTNQFNKLNSLVGTGQSSAVGQGQISSNVASNIGSNIIGAGNAQAASSIATGNAISGAANNAITYNYLNKALQNTGTNNDAYSQALAGNEQEPAGLADAMASASY